MTLVIGLLLIGGWWLWSYRLIQADWTQRRDAIVLDMEIAARGLPEVMRERWRVL